MRVLIGQKPMTCCSVTDIYVIQIWHILWWKQREEKPWSLHEKTCYFTYNCLLIVVVKIIIASLIAWSWCSGKKRRLTTKGPWLSYRNLKLFSQINKHDGLQISSEFLATTSFCSRCFYLFQFLRTILASASSFTYHGCYPLIHWVPSKLRYVSFHFIWHSSLLRMVAIL